jgi:F0F1-type ATP synthase membrane subunit b/b'
MFDNKPSILHDAEVEAYKMIVDEGKAKMEEDSLPDMENRRNMISKTLKKLNEGLVERVEETQLLLLAALCREHLLLLGPPGTGVTISVTS